MLCYRVGKWWWIAISSWGALAQENLLSARCIRNLRNWGSYVPGRPPNFKNKLSKRQRVFSKLFLIPSLNVPLLNKKLPGLAGGKIARGHRLLAGEEFDCIPSVDVQVSKEGIFPVGERERA